MPAADSAASTAPAPSRFTSDNWAKLRQSPAYDVLMRLPLLSWAFVGATAAGLGLVPYLHKGAAAAAAALSAPVLAVTIAMRLSTFIFFVLLAAAAIARARPTAMAPGAAPRLCALAGSFLLYALPLFPRRELSPAAGIVSTLLVLAGSAGAGFVLIQLGRSFSIMAEARRLVTSGVYRVVRHPLYLAEELAVFGVVMQFLSYWTALVLVMQIACQLRRMRNEEAVLAETFPEYTAYRARTARLIPRVY
jgi:protein-S-isoprenylcysteine O-methyltransferase Ste14